MLGWEMPIQVAECHNDFIVIFTIPCWMCTDGILALISSLTFNISFSYAFFANMQFKIYLILKSLKNFVYELSQLKVQESIHILW